MSKSSPITAAIAYVRNSRDADAPLLWRLRWSVLRAYGESVSGQAVLDSLRVRCPLVLTLREDQFNDVIRLLAEPFEWPRRLRPRGEWRDAHVDLDEYKRELAATTSRIGLSGPRSWSSTSGEPPPVWIDWPPLMHAYLRHGGRGDEGRDCWLKEIAAPPMDEDPLLPWLDQLPRGAGRPRSVDEPRLRVFATCIGRALAGDEWPAITFWANEQLGAETTVGALQIYCRRLAKRLDVFRQL